MRYVFIAIMSLLYSLGYAHAEACNDYSVRVTTTPVPMQYRDALGRWDKVKAELNSKADIIFLGDSLVEAWAPEKLQAVSSGLQTQNLGVSRDRVQNVLWRLSNIRLGRFSPKKVVIFLGTNNLGDESPDACAIAAGIKKTVEVVQKAWPKATVYFIGIIPRGPDFHFRENVRIAINQEMRGWAHKNYRFVSVDEREITCGKIDLPSDGARNACTPALACGNFKPDNLHLETPGYDIVNKALEAAFLAD